MVKWFLGDSIKKIVIKPSAPSELFVVIKNKGIYKTVDAGFNWQDLTESFSGYSLASNIYNLVLDPQRNNVLYLTSAYGLLRSDDDGNSWKSIKILVNPQALPVQDIAIDKNDYKIMYMSAGSKIYKSEDGGENWMVKSLNTGKNIELIRIDHKNPRVIFVGIHK